MELIRCRKEGFGILSGDDALTMPLIAAGADGLLVEMHPNPCEAWCDADQAINPQELISLMGELRGIAKVIGREIL